MKAIKVDWYSQEDWQILYRKLVLEARMFASESGSEHVLVWILNCTCKVFVYINDPRYRMALLVDCGFLIYNLILDMTGRYAIRQNTTKIFQISVEEFKKQVNLLKEPFLSCGFENQVNDLDALCCLIQAAFCAHSHKRSGVMKQLEKFKKWKAINFPNIIDAMLQHQRGLFACSSNKSEANGCFENSLSVLGIDCNSVEALYYYNTLYGNFLSMFNFKSQ